MHLYKRTNFSRIAGLTLVKKLETIKGILSWKVQTQKIKIIMIHISCKNILTKE